MKTTTVNLQIRVGTTTSITLRLSYLGVPVNLSGYSASLSCGDLMDLDTEALGGLTLGGAAGTIAISRTPAQSRALTFGSRPIASKVLRRATNGTAQVATGYIQDYQLDLIAPDGATVRAFVGSIVFSPEV